MKIVQLIILGLLLIGNSTICQVQCKTQVHCKSVNKEAIEAFNWGVVSMSHNDIDIAMKFFLGAMRKDTFFCDAYDNLAHCFKLKGDYKSASKLYLMSMKIDTSNPVPYINLASIHNLIGNYDKSKEIYETMIDNLPENPEGYYGLSFSLHSLGNYELAYEMINKSIDCSEKRHLEIGKEVQLLKGIIYFDYGKMEEAKEILLGVNKEFKNDPNLNYYLGKCFLLIDNDIKTAKKYIKKAKRWGYVVDLEIEEQLKI
ncbi:MAG: hypothetical protein K9H64_17805 [Bacteroidales bacterium]|nr:hypothetical protein [Bacteroidales bacterium]MCF8457876.1 hypothetical protein [Bacteroidales bacterium]